MVTSELRMHKTNRIVHRCYLFVIYNRLGAGVKTYSKRESAYLNSNQTNPYKASVTDCASLEFDEAVARFDQRGEIQLTPTRPRRSLFFCGPFNFLDLVLLRTYLR